MKWLLILLIIAVSPSVAAWGPSGHRIVCHIAWHSLSDPLQQQTASAAKRMGFQNFADSCVWADHIRFYPQFDSLKVLHYVNVPKSADSVDRRRDCHNTEKPGCVLTAITDYRQRWKNPALSQQQRDQALLLLSHFIGDVHQPMHVAYQFDRGGNRRIVTWMNNKSLSLHRLWDTAIIGCNNKNSWQKIAHQLLSDISPQQRQQWGTIAINQENTIDQWANESLALTRKIYRELEQSWQPADYCQRFTPVAQQRLQMAGIRLAALIND